MGNKCCAGTKYKTKPMNPEEFSSGSRNSGPQYSFRRLSSQIHTKTPIDTRDDDQVQKDDASDTSNPKLIANSGSVSPAEIPDERKPASPSSKHLLSNKAPLGGKIIHTKTAELPAKYLQKRKKLGQGEEDKQNEHLADLEVPKLRVSPTIKISKEWMPENQNIRRQSTIHQIQEKISPKKSIVSHQSTLPFPQNAFELTLQKKRNSYGNIQKQASGMSQFVKADSLNSNKLSGGMEDDLAESEEPAFSRASSLQQEFAKGMSLRSQGKSTARFKINPISAAISSQNSMSPNHGRTSKGAKEFLGGSFKQQNVIQDSFARIPSTGSKDHDEILPKDQAKQSDKVQDDNQSNFALLVQGMMFGKHPHPNQESDNISDDHDEASSPVLGRLKSNQEATPTLHHRVTGAFQDSQSSDQFSKMQALHETANEAQPKIDRRSTLNPKVNIPVRFKKSGGSLDTAIVEESSETQAVQTVNETFAKDKDSDYNFTSAQQQQQQFLHQASSISTIDTSKPQGKNPTFEPITEERETPSTKKHADSPRNLYRQQSMHKQQPKGGYRNLIQMARLQSKERVEGQNTIESKKIETNVVAKAEVIIPAQQQQPAVESSKLAVNNQTAPQGNPVIGRSSLLSGHNPSRQQRDLLRPIKTLSKELSVEQLDQLLGEKRSVALRKELNKLVSTRKIVSSDHVFDTLSPIKPVTENTITDQIAQGGQGEQSKLKLQERVMSPFQMKKRSAELSPLDTIEISEDMLHAGTPTDDGMSDMSITPVSEFRNISQYMKSDTSIHYEIEEVEYDAAKRQSANQLKMQKFQSEDMHHPNTTRQITTSSSSQQAIKKPFLKNKSENDNLVQKQTQFSSLSSLTNQLTQDNLKILEEADSVSGSQNQGSGTVKAESQHSRSIITQKTGGQKKINQYIVVKTIGQGSFGKVKLALDSENNNRPCAMKVLSKRRLKKIFIGKNRTAMNDVMQEIAVMKKLDHDNVVKLYEVLDDPLIDKLYIVMEYVKNGSLMQKLSKTKTLQPHNLWKYFRDLITGLHYLHECAGVVHRDLKPENMLIDENDKLKISDFGVSFLVENGCDEIQTTAGSNYFFSPEICKGQMFKAKKCDIWAAGVTLYFMFFKKYPFTANNIPALYNKIINQEPEYPSDANPLLVSFLKRLLVKDPEQRISLQEIIQHDWITSNGIQPLQIHISPQIHVTPSDTMNAIQKVRLIAKIKLRIKSKIEQAKQQIALKNSNSPLLKTPIKQGLNTPTTLHKPQ